MIPDPEQSRRALGIHREADGWVSVVDHSGLVTRYELRPLPVLEKPVKAVLLDLDGTTLRSEDFWVSMLAETLSRCGGADLTNEDAWLLRGGTTEAHLRQLMTRYDLQGGFLEVRATYEQVVEERFFGAPLEHLSSEIPIADGFAEVRSELALRGIPLLLVTNGDRAKATREMEVIAHQIGAEAPESVCSGVWCSSQASVDFINAFGARAGKPHPWPYLEAASSGAGVESGQMASVIGVDDSIAGLVSIRLSGAIPFALASPGLDVLGGDDFASRSLQTLGELLYDID